MFFHSKEMWWLTNKAAVVGSNPATLTMIGHTNEKRKEVRLFTQKLAIVKKIRVSS